MPEVTSDRVYFPNLNSIRFVAALLVIIHHVEQFKFIYGFQNYWNVPAVALIGKLGVILFFCLSGFLITYLLLTEEKQTQTISVSDFYKRRILRIWPLYYFLIAISFLLLNRLPFLNVPGFTDGVYNSLSGKLLMFIFFIPNVALFVFAPVPFISQTWSVGVEEQFYLLWPWLMKKFKSKQTVLIFVVVAYMVIKLSSFVLIRTSLWNKDIALFYGFWDSFNIDCMAIGGIMAYWLFTKSYMLNYVFNRYFQMLVLLALLLLISFGVVIPMVHYEVYGVLFSVLIVNFAANENRIISLENSILSYLGKVSYGIYMYHPLAIVFCLFLLSALGWNYGILQYGMTLFLTILISVVSYEYFEKRFIKMKIRFSKVVSGEPE